MTSLGMAAAAALLAGVGSADMTGGPVAASGIDTGAAKVIQVRTGYFRRDLGLDPAYSNYRHYDRSRKGKGKRTRGFRQDGAPHYNGAGILFFYDGGHSYIGHNGLRIHHADPGLLEK